MGQFGSNIRQAREIEIDRLADGSIEGEYLRVEDMARKRRGAQPQLVSGGIHHYGQWLRCGMIQGVMDRNSGSRNTEIRRSFNLDQDRGAGTRDGK